MRFSLTLPQKGLVLVTVPLLLQLAFLLIMTVLLRQAEYEAQREARAKELAIFSDYLLSSAESFHMVLINFRDTGEKNNFRIINRLFATFNRALPQLRKDTRGNLRLERAQENLEALCGQLENIFRQATTLSRDDVNSWNVLISETARTVALFKTETERLHLYGSPEGLFAEGGKGSYREKLKVVIMIGAVADIALALAAAAFFSLQIVRRLRVLMENNQRLAEELPLLPKVGGGDEIEKLDGGFHEMAEALVEARRKERAMVENAVDVICSMDASGKFSNVNVASEKVWGYEREELLSQPYETIVAKDDLRTTEKAVREIIEAKGFGSFENRIVRKDAVLIPALWTASWSATEQSLFCVVHDITERKELERLKADFVAMVSHDLRTPLASLQGGLLLLQSGKHGALSERGQKFVETGVRSADRLIGLINDLLDVEKLEAGKFDMEMREIQLGDVLERSAIEVKSLSDKAGVTVECPTVDITMRADADRLVQVLVNLLGNAIKFSPADSKITISAEQPTGWVEVRITDRGPGIPLEYKDAVFDRFRQLPGGKQKKGSTGLGLAICKTIIEQHGGEIGVDSELGQGSTFWFRIPSGEEEPE
jgi:PAS domain S-box-containing protein